MLSSPLHSSPALVYTTRSSVIAAAAAANQQAKSDHRPQSPLSLARDAWDKVAKQMNTTASRLPSRSGRTDPCSVPCSPTFSYCTPSIATREVDTLNEEVALYRTASQVHQRPSRVSYSGPLSPNDFSLNSERWILEEKAAREKAQGWLQSQQLLQENNLSREDNEKTIRGRGRAYSESCASMIVEGGMLAPPMNTWKRPGKGRVCNIDLVPELQLDPIIDCIAEEDAKDAKGWRDSIGTVAAEVCISPTFTTTLETTHKGEKILSNNNSLSFNIRYGQHQCSFTLTQSELDELQYIDLQHHCHLVDPQFPQEQEYDIFMVLTNSEALALGVTRSDLTPTSYHLALLQPWSTDTAMSIQQLLIKQYFYQIMQRGEKVKLFILEKESPDATMPQESTRSLSQIGDARGETDKIISNNTCEEIKGEGDNDQTVAESNCPSSILSRFSRESSIREDVRPRSRSESRVQHTVKRKKCKAAPLHLPVLTKTTFAFVGNNVSPSTTITALSPRSNSFRNMDQKQSKPKSTFKSKCRDEAALAGNGSKMMISRGIRCSNQVLKRAAGYFKRPPLTLETFLPQSPTTASASKAEVCALLPNGSVEHPFWKQMDSADNTERVRKSIEERKQEEGEEGEEEGRGEEEEEGEEKEVVLVSDESDKQNTTSTCVKEEEGEGESEVQEVIVPNTKIERVITLDSTFSSERYTGDKSRLGHSESHRSRSNSISMLFKFSFPSTSVSPEHDRCRKASLGKISGNILRQQMHKMEGTMCRFKKSKNDDWRISGETKRSTKVAKSIGGASASFYSTSSLDIFEDGPLTGKTTVAESSPCLTDSSLLSPLTGTSTPTSSFSSSRPPRKRSGELGFPKLQSEEILDCKTMSHSLSLSKESTGWICSDEDLEPEVRDCVSSLSGTIKGGLFVSRQSIDSHTDTFQRKSLDQEEMESTTSLDSSTATIVSSRATIPGSAPLLQRYSSLDQLRI